MSIVFEIIFGIMLLFAFVCCFLSGYYFGKKDKCLSLLNEIQEMNEIHKNMCREYQKVINELLKKQKTEND